MRTNASASVDFSPVHFTPLASLKVGRRLDFVDSQRDRKSLRTTSLRAFQRVRLPATRHGLRATPAPCGLSKEPSSLFHSAGCCQQTEFGNRRHFKAAMEKTGDYRGEPRAYVRCCGDAVTAPSMRLHFALQRGQTCGKRAADGPQIAYCGAESRPGGPGERVRASHSYTTPHFRTFGDLETRSSETYGVRHARRSSRDYICLGSTVSCQDFYAITRKSGSIYRPILRWVRRRAFLAFSRRIMLATSGCTLHAALA